MNIKWVPELFWHPHNIKYDFKVESYKKDGSTILKGSEKTTSCYTTRNLSSPSKSGFG